MGGIKSYRHQIDRCTQACTIIITHVGPSVPDDDEVEIPMTENVVYGVDPVKTRSLPIPTPAMLVTTQAVCNYPTMITFNEMNSITFVIIYEDTM